MAHDLGRATFRRTAGAALAHQSERGSKTPEFTEYVERGHNNEWTDQDQPDRPGRDTLEGGDDVSSPQMQTGEKENLLAQ